ncbi:MAG TPA: hypothetical protein PKV21_08370 [bacterium]|nr:hypothetical protein [bacterium]HOM27503.1 hypothetical protein [bacterium]
MKFLSVIPPFHTSIPQRVLSILIVKFGYKTQYRNYLENLEKLVPEILPSLPLDPFTGKEYVYKKKGNGFLIYSLGKNQKNDNGIYNLKKRADDIGFEILF